MRNVRNARATTMITEKLLGSDRLYIPRVVALKPVEPVSLCSSRTEPPK